MPYLILLNKPKGVTSFHAVARVRRALGEKRIGHTGTLDPMATGVLPLLTGRASRLSSLMLDADKSYRATVRLGTVTDTLDITGEVLKTSPVNVSDQQLLDALGHFTGEITQVPPMYSALKKDGVRLYELARQGKEVKRESRQVKIKELKLVERLGSTDFVIDVTCSKGTYIRTLGSDIGEYLGVGATLTELQRTAVSGFSIDTTVPLDEFEQEPQKYLLSPELCVKHLSKVNVTEAQSTRFLHGGQLDLNRLHGLSAITDNQLLRVKCGDRFLGIGKIDLRFNQLSVGCIIME